MNKLLIGLALLASVGWGLAYWGWKRPLPSPQTITKIEYIDRVKTETIVRTITKKDGTVIQETIGSKSETKQTTASKAVKAPLDRWSLGLTVSTRSAHLLAPTPIYGLTVGHRLLETPVWMDLGVKQNLELTLGLSLKF